MSLMVGSKIVYNDKVHRVLYQGLDTLILQDMETNEMFIVDESEVVEDDKRIYPNKKLLRS